MTHPHNTGPKDPALHLELQAEALEKSIERRKVQILELAEQMGDLSDANTRDASFAQQYRDAAGQLRGGFTMFVVDAGAFDIGDHRG